MGKKKLKKMARRAKELLEEYQGIKGMADEMYMRVLILREKVAKAKQEKKSPPPALVEEVRTTDLNFHRDQAKYLKRVKEINDELKEISDAITQF